MFREMSKYYETVKKFMLQQKPKFSVKAKPQQLAELLPVLRRIEIHKYGSEQKSNNELEKQVFIALEGKNLWFFRKVRLEGIKIDYEVKNKEVSGNFIQVNLGPKNNETLSKLLNPTLRVGIETSFEGVTRWERATVYTKVQFSV